MKRLAAPLLVSAALSTGALWVIADRPDEHPGRSAATGQARGLVVVGPGQSALRQAFAEDESGAVVRADASGRLHFTTSGVYTVQAPGYLPRSVAVHAHKQGSLSLTPTGGSISLRFAGDTMFGRRFYAPVPAVGDGTARLNSASTAADITDLLKPMRPFLTDSDLTVVNLETALAENPAALNNAKRPAGLHPTKKIVLTSSTDLPAALAAAGVDVVDLANNHVNDALAPGITQLLRRLDAAGVKHFGAGRTVEEAWRPLTVTVRDQQVSFIGCTTVEGGEHPVPYVATATQPGAAACDPVRLEQEVKRAAARGPVVTMIHGDVEYARVQTPMIRRLSMIAQRAGAVVVANGHPHVFGGVEVTDLGVSADSLGNFVFDQPVWATLASATVRVDLVSGRPAVAAVDPVLVEDYLPRPAIGEAADAVARLASGLRGGLALGDGTAVWPAPQGGARSMSRFEGVHHLPAGVWVEKAGSARVGQDLLFGTGTMEPQDVDGGVAGARMWAFGKYARATGQAACVGAQGVTLERSSVSREDVFLTPQHRQAVAPGQRLSLLLRVRRASGGIAELRWFPTMEGESTRVASTPLPKVREGCELVRIDVTVPAGMSAVQPFLRLSPPANRSLTSSMDIDEVRLVAWGAPGASGRQWDVVDGMAGSAVTLASDLPGQAPTVDPVDTVTASDDPVHH